MDWESAKKHCVERNWQWSLQLIKQAQKEVNYLEYKLETLEKNYKKLSDKFHSL